jgi:hypothetical protein
LRWRPPSGALTHKQLLAHAAAPLVDIAFASQREAVAFIKRARGVKPAKVVSQQLP